MFPSLHGVVSLESYDNLFTATLSSVYHRQFADPIRRSTCHSLTLSALVFISLSPKKIVARAGARMLHISPFFSTPTAAAPSPIRIAFSDQSQTFSGNCSNWFCFVSAFSCSVCLVECVRISDSVPFHKLLKKKKNQNIFISFPLSAILSVDISEFLTEWNSNAKQRI